MDEANGGGRREAALSLQARAKWDIRKSGGYTVPCRWARRHARRTKWRQPGRVRIVMARTDYANCNGRSPNLQNCNGTEPINPIFNQATVIDGSSP